MKCQNNVNESSVVNLIKAFGQRFFVTVGLFMLTRIFLTVAFHEQNSDTLSAYGMILLSGLAYDCLVALAILLPFSVAMLIRQPYPIMSRLKRLWLSVTNTVFYFFVVYIGVVEYFYFDEFNARFNYVAVDYLLFPHEVFVNIWDSYPVGKALTLTALAAYALHRLTWPTFALAITASSTRKQRAQPLLGQLILITLGLNLLQINNIANGDNRVVNELSLNGYYTFVHALFTNELNYEQHYATIEQKRAHALTQKQIGLGSEIFDDGASPIVRKIAGEKKQSTTNVVLVIEESLGSEFSALLHPENDIGVTPELDALAREGLLYSHIYASGNRTVRGLEAILTSFTPIPGQAIVKRPGFADVFSLPALLQQKGYATRFIYGGYGYFDNMGEFARRNGFDTVIDQTDFAADEISFTTSWGVCDEDLFDKSLKEIDSQAQANKPFFTTILTVSNHKPYLYPAGRIAQDPTHQKRRHAVQYADFALGRFIKAAKAKSWFDNTLFVILGDHGARLYGEAEIPLSSYEIPLIFYAPSFITAQQDDRLGAQIDVAPTIMGLLDIEYSSAFFGRDLRRISDAPRYALLSHNRDVALLRDNRMAVLGINQSVHLWQVIDRDGALSPLPLDHDPELIDDTIALYQTGYELYSQRNWRPLPQNYLSPATAARSTITLSE